MDESISGFVNQAIDDKTFPGAVVGYLKDGKTHVMAFGHQEYDKDSPVIHEDTLFDVASVTKSIPTNSLILWLIDNNKLALDDVVSDFIPELEGPYRKEITIRHLLTYTVVYDLNGRGLSQFAKEGPDSLLGVLLGGKLSSTPGSTYYYTNIPAILLGMVVERVLKKSLDVAAAEIFFEPLGMKRSTFTPEQFPLDEIAPTEIDDWRGKVHGAPHDESAWTLHQIGKIGGHAALFTTAGDLLIFAQMLLNGGEYEGKRYLSPSIIKQATTNQIAELGLSTGLGWELNQPAFMGKYSAHLFGKSGFTGCLILIDPTTKRAMVLISNYPFPKRKADRGPINKVRVEIADLIFAP